jgi:hypothetical protein
VQIDGNVAMHAANAIGRSCFVICLLSHTVSLLQSIDCDQQIGPLENFH